jgi:hypothetical protein
MIHGIIAAPASVERSATAGGLTDSKEKPEAFDERWYPLPRNPVESALAGIATADLRYEHATKRGPLTALLLAHNLFGDSFFEASCRLGGKPTGHFL